jgi:hypothetical protein
MSGNSGEINELETRFQSCSQASQSWVDLRVLLVIAIVVWLLLWHSSGLMWHSMATLSHSSGLLWHSMATTMAIVLLLWHSIATTMA